MKYILGLALLYSSVGFTAENSTLVEISVTEKGFEPSSINVQAGKPITLAVTRKTDDTCSKEIQIPIKKIKKDLPLNETVKIDIGSLKKGKIRFGCGMNMMDSGKIYAE